MFNNTETQTIVEIAETLGWRVLKVEASQNKTDEQWVVSNSISNNVAYFKSEDAAWDYVSYRLGVMPYLNMQTDSQNFMPPLLSEMLDWRHPKISKEEYNKEPINFYLWTEKSTNLFNSESPVYTMTVAIGYKNNLNEDKISYEIFKQEAANDGLDLHMSKLDCLFEIYQKFLAWKRKF